MWKEENKQEFCHKSELGILGLRDFNKHRCKYLIMYVYFLVLRWPWSSGSPVPKAVSTTSTQIMVFPNSSLHLKESGLIKQRLESRAGAGGNRKQTQSIFNAKQGSTQRVMGHEKNTEATLKGCHWSNLG